MTKDQTQLRATTKSGILANIEKICLLIIVYGGQALVEAIVFRQDFRNFRLDRITSLKISEDRFTDEKGKRLLDYKQCEKSKRDA